MQSTLLYCCCLPQVQLRHNTRKSAAIKELLSIAAAGAPGDSTTAAAGGKHSSSRGDTKLHRSPGNPSAVLQGLLDDLLAIDGDDEAGDISGAAGRSGFKDDSTTASEY